MTSSAVTTPNERFAFPWMFGRTIDILFFFLPVGIGVALFALSQMSAINASTIWLLLILNAFGAGPFHWGPTWFAYFDRKNRQHWLSQPNKLIIFFAGPPLILLLSVLGNIYVTWLAQGITLVWAIQHLVQQNVGILLLYHNQGKGEAIVNRPVEIRSQHAPTIFFSTFFFYRVFMHSPEGFVWLAGIAALGAWAAYSVAMYLLELGKQLKEGAYLNVPATAFWLLSVISLLPFALLGKNFYEAFVIPVTVHWFQYIGLNFVLVKNKYTPEAQLENLPQIAPLPLFFTTCIFWLSLWLALAFASTTVAADSLTFKLVTGTIIGLANCHYFLDAFLWRFRESYQRQTLLPYLLRPRQLQARDGGTGSGMRPGAQT